MPPLLLLTRPPDQSARFARQVRAAGASPEVRIAPLSEIRARAFDPAAFAGGRGLVLTSANAVPPLAGLAQVRGLPAWCVGPATAGAATAAGFRALDAGGDAAALLRLLREQRPQGRLIHARGAVVVRDLKPEARALGLDWHEVVVYTAEPCAWPEGLAASLTGRAVVAPLFSPRAAELFARALGGLRPEGLVPVAISAACAARLPPDLRARTRISDRPDGGGMLRAVLVELSQFPPMP